MALTIPTVPQFPQQRGGRVDIFIAAARGNIEEVHRALVGGADPNARSKGQTPLMYAAENGHAEICSLLLANGALVNAVESYNRTALHLAVKNLHVEVCRVLMEAGAKIDIESTLGGETVADIVHVRGTIEIVRTVLYFGTGSVATPNLLSASPTPTKASEPPKSDEMAAAVEAATPTRERQQPVALDTVSVAAASIPRRAPVPQVDESRRCHTPPRKIK